MIQLWAFIKRCRAFWKSWRGFVQLCKSFLKKLENGCKTPWGSGKLVLTIFIKRLGELKKRTRTVFLFFLGRLMPLLILYVKIHVSTLHSLHLLRWTGVFLRLEWDTVNRVKGLGNNFPCIYRIRWFVFSGELKWLLLKDYWLKKWKD